MKTKLTALLIITILFNSNVIQAKGKTSLRLNLKKGSVYEMTTTLTNVTNQELMGKKTKVDQKMETGFTFKVLDVLPNKNFVLGFSIAKIKMAVNMNGREANYDSESTGGNNPMAVLLKNLPAKKIVVTPAGKLVSMESYSLKELVGDPQIVGLMTSFLSNNRLESFIGQAFNYFPENKVGPGDKWSVSVKLATVMNLPILINFEVVSIEKDKIALKVSSNLNESVPIEQNNVKIDVNMVGTQNGTMTVNRADGWIRASDLVQKFNLKMKMKDPKTKEDTESPSTTNSEIKTRVVKK